MKVYGHTITPGVINACEQRMREREFKASDIENKAIECGIPKYEDRQWVAHRVADRLIQKHRKLGNISLCAGGKWKSLKSWKPSEGTTEILKAESPYCAPPPLPKTLTWYNRTETPAQGSRILAFSPRYEDHQATMRWRIMDGQFLRLCPDIQYWAYLELQQP